MNIHYNNHLEYSLNSLDDFLCDKKTHAERTSVIHLIIIHEQTKQ